MASTKEYLNFILEQLSDLDDVNNREVLCELVRSMWEELPEKKKQFA